MIRLPMLLLCFFGAAYISLTVENRASVLILCAAWGAVLGVVNAKYFQEK